MVSSNGTVVENALAEIVLRKGFVGEAAGR